MVTKMLVPLLSISNLLHPRQDDEGRVTVILLDGMPRARDNAIKYFAMSLSLIFKIGENIKNDKLKFARVALVVDCITTETFVELVVNIGILLVAFDIFVFVVVIAEKREVVLKIVAAVEFRMAEVVKRLVTDVAMLVVLAVVVLAAVLTAVVVDFMIFVVVVLASFIVVVDMFLKSHVVKVALLVGIR